MYLFIDTRDLAQALQTFKATKEFYSGIGELSFEENNGLLTWAATMTAASDLEKQAEADDDESLRAFMRRVRSCLAAHEKALLDNPKWMSVGKRNSESAMLRRFGNRLAMGIFGGLSLLVPMMIMVLSPTKLTNLVTTIAFVIFVAIALSTAMDDSEAKDIFAAVAAYTAVLVVFVGTSTSPQGESDGVVGAIAGGVLGGILVLMGAWFAVFYPLFLKREKKKRATSESDFERRFKFYL